MSGIYLLPGYVGFELDEHNTDKIRLKNKVPPTESEQLFRSEGEEREFGATND